MVCRRKSCYQLFATRQIPGHMFIFQQDNDPAHCARDQLASLKRETTAFISPDLWSPNSPDVSPVHYKIRAAMQCSARVPDNDSRYRWTRRTTLGRSAQHWALHHLHGDRILAQAAYSLCWKPNGGHSNIGRSPVHDNILDSWKSVSICCSHGDSQNVFAFYWTQAFEVSLTKRFRSANLSVSLRWQTNR